MTDTAEQLDDKRASARSSRSTRDAIIATAATMFAERGYLGTTVRQIADEVGIQSGSVFHHFGSKEAVLLEVVAAGLSKAKQRIAQEQASLSQPRERLRAMIRGHLSALLDPRNPETMSVFFFESHALSPEGRKKVISMRDEYEQMWSEALAALGRYPDADVRRLKRLLLFGAMNWCAQWYHADGLYDVDAITDSLYESFIEAPPARRKK